MNGFTQKKFLSFTSEKKHKECAKLLKQIFEKGNEQVLYQTYLSWMGLNCNFPLSKNEIRDRFHFHLQKAGIYLKEHNYLISTKDRDMASPTLGIDIYLDNIRSAHNVGSILRTTEALSLGTIHFGGLTPLPTHKKVKDASMHTTQWIQWQQTSSLEKLQRPFIALETSPDGVSINDYIFPKSFTLFLGNEEYGLSDFLLEQADICITIPLYGRKNSLNVANAFAIAAHEIRRSTHYL